MILLYNSKIILFTNRVINKLRIYYENSLLKRVIKVILEFLYTILKGSGTYRFLTSFWDHKESSITNMLNSINKGLTRAVNKKTLTIFNNSTILNKLGVLVDNFIEQDSQILGLFLVSFSAVAAFKTISTRYSTYFLMFDFILLLLGIILVIVNRPIKSLLKGSKFALIVYRLFVIEES